MYKSDQHKVALATVLFFFVLFILGSCANMGSPEGGPFDTTPPRMIKATPPPNSVNVKPKKITLYFDENINLEKQREKVIVSPPQTKEPKFNAVGKTLDIEFEEELMNNTTYSFNFNDAIVDYTEGNKLKGFTYAFSTGPTIDTMQMSGIMLDARTLEPVQNKVVGVYQAGQDSLFKSKKFKYATRTDNEGQFKLLNLSTGKYRIFGLEDNDNNFYFSQPNEGIAFDKTEYLTTVKPANRTDTIKIKELNALRDTVVRDSLITEKYIRYQPDNIVLRLFKENLQRMGISRSTRPDSLFFTVDFLTPPTRLVPVKLVDQSGIDADKAIFITRGEKNMLEYWFTDPRLVRAESVKMLITYDKTDSLGKVLAATDTLDFNRSKFKEKKSGKNQDEPLLNLQITGSKGVYGGTPGDTIKLIANRPLSPFDESKIKINKVVDSVSTPISFTIKQDSMYRKQYYLMHQWEFDTQYKVNIDSAAIKDVYGVGCNKTEFGLRIQAEKELSSLEITLENTDDRAIVELLDKSDNVVAVIPAKYLAPSANTDSTVNKKMGDTARGVRDSASSNNLIPQKQPTQTSTTDSVAAKSPPLIIANKDSLTIPKDSTVVADSLAATSGAADKKLMAKFDHIQPGDYYARLFVDANGNGVWDTGEYPDKQPEDVYYCPIMFALKKGFTTGETWQVNKIPLNKQKPLELRKVKPEENKEEVDKNIEYNKRMDERKRERSKDKDSNKAQEPFREVHRVTGS
ncbi:Ig-like domain-containing domain [Porphyromonas pogonae]|uniref:Ig-like domain-containing protein n=1 Tax=Porphyromonas pogonae TaxID=867595 RepID=UPI002E786929|nr:Ig-like domain-containing domain [Porphyromonas pogonae]